MNELLNLRATDKHVETNGHVQPGAQTSRAEFCYLQGWLAEFGFLIKRALIKQAERK